jgi:hypothetical protein
MADYTCTFDYNKGTDGTPDWTGTSIAASGSSGANEFRFAKAGAGAGGTSSANWPKFRRLASPGVVDELWAFSADTTGTKVATYDGTKSAARVVRLNFNNAGTPVSAMKFSSYADTSLGAATPGTQPSDPSSDGSGVVNGHATDTSSTAYLKGNAYGSGLTAGGSQETPSSGAAGTTLAATSGSAGAATPSAASWLSTWQSLQADTQYIQGPATPQAVTAFFWYIVLSLWSGPNLCLGSNIAPVFACQYDRT